MDKVVKILSAIQAIAKADDDELAEEIKDFEDADFLLDQVNKFEKKIAKLLKQERKHFTDALEGYIQKAEDDESYRLADYVNIMLGDTMAADVFAAEMSAAASTFLYATVPQVTSTIMQAIDKDVAFEVLSKKSEDWIESWSEELGRLMKLRSHKEVEDILAKTIREGKGIPDAVKELKDLPAFNRQRARVTAITEILTASSVAQQEAYTQSPAVTTKVWKHSGTRKIKPRDSHVALSGTEVGVDETFDVEGEAASFPRDTSLSPKQRISCHCVLGPGVDPFILGLNKEEKEAIRKQVLDDLGRA